MAYSGKFKPRNISKYRGKVDQITFRSLWERTLFTYCDNKDFVVKWSSEDYNCVIPYFDPVKNKQRRYFCDVWARIRHPVSGEYQDFLIEVKPKKETREPAKPKRQTAKSKTRYLTECATYATNMAKWEAAMKYCKKKNMRFMIFTEDQLV